MSLSNYGLTENKSKFVKFGLKMVKKQAFIAPFYQFIAVFQILQI